MDALIWALHIVTYHNWPHGHQYHRQFGYIFLNHIDYKVMNYSFLFAIYLNPFDPTLAKPLVHIALESDWV